MVNTATANSTDVNRIPTHKLREGLPVKSVNLTLNAIVNSVVKMENAKVNHFKRIVLQTRTAPLVYSVALTLKSANNKS